jgi:hypothetical protein
MRDLTIVLDDVPGSLARLGNVLGEAGVNIEGGCAITDAVGTIAHILVSDPSRARGLLEANGFEVKEELEAISFYVSGDDRPGIIGRYAGRIAEAGVNIERMYLASGSRLAFVTDDNARARAAIRA